jgi:hypothetical protein
VASFPKTADCFCCFRFHILQSIHELCFLSITKFMATVLVVLWFLRLCNCHKMCSTITSEIWQDQFLESLSTDIFQDFDEDSTANENTSEESDSELLINVWYLKSEIRVSIKLTSPIRCLFHWMVYMYLIMITQS